MVLVLLQNPVGSYSLSWRRLHESHDDTRNNIHYNLFLDNVKLGLDAIGPCRPATAHSMLAKDSHSRAILHYRTYIHTHLTYLLESVQWKLMHSVSQCSCIYGSCEFEATNRFGHRNPWTHHCRTAYLSVLSECSLAVNP